MRYTVSYTYRTESGHRMTVTDYFRDYQSAIEHAAYIRRLHNIATTIS